MFVIARREGERLRLDQGTLEIVTQRVDDDQVLMGYRENDGPVSTRWIERDQFEHVRPDIKVTLIDIRGDKARWGIECPNGMDVHRQEVWEAIQRERNKNNSEA